MPLLIATIVQEVHPAHSHGTTIHHKSLSPHARVNAYRLNCEFNIRQAEFRCPPVQNVAVRCGTLPWSLQTRCHERV